MQTLQTIFESYLVSYETLDKYHNKLVTLVFFLTQLSLEKSLLFSL